MAYSGAYGARGGARGTEPAPAAEAEENAVKEPPPAELEPPTRQGQTGERKRPFDLGSIFKKTETAGMETDDLLMALILYLMYRESGDKDLLIMLGAMLLT